MREYSPYFVTQLRGCLVAARAHREAQLEAWEAIGECSKLFHSKGPRPPVFEHPDEAPIKYRKTLLFRSVLAISSQRAGPDGLGAFWSTAEEFSANVKNHLLPALRECKSVHRWDTPVSKDVCHKPYDDGNPCTLVLAHAYQAGWVKTIFQHHRLEAVRYQAHLDTMGEMKKIGLTKEAMRAVIKPITKVPSRDKLGDVPDSDQGMVDFYWQAMLEAGIEGRMTLHKAMLSYMTERYLKTSKVSLGNWIEHKGY